MKLKDLLNESTVKVPKFKTDRDAARFIKKLKDSDVVSGEVSNWDTGEVFMEKGWSKEKIRADKKNWQNWIFTKDFSKLLESKINEVRVPYLKTEKQAKAFLDKLGLDDKVNDDVIAMETGKVFLKKGETKRKLMPVSKIKEFKGRPDSDNDIMRFYKVKLVSWLSTLPTSHRKEIEAWNNEAELEQPMPMEVSRKDGKPFTDNDELVLSKYAKYWSKRLTYAGFQGFEWSWGNAIKGRKQIFGSPIMW